MTIKEVIQKVNSDLGYTKAVINFSEVEAIESSRSTIYSDQMELYQKHGGPIIVYGDGWAMEIFFPYEEAKQLMMDSQTPSQGSRVCESCDGPCSKYHDRCVPCENPEWEYDDDSRDS